MGSSQVHRRSLARYKIAFAASATIIACHFLPKTQKNEVFDGSILHARSKHEANAEYCGFQGNSDLYGMGIRIGLYLQSMALWLSSNIVRRRHTEQNTLGVIFMLSMMLILLTTTIGNSIHAAEAFVLLQMVILISWYMSSVLVGNRPTLLLYKRGLESKLICEAIIGVGLSYNTWFWWAGLDQLEPTACGTFGFYFFWRFDLFGGIRIVNKIISIMVVMEIPQRLVWHCVGFKLLWKSRSLRRMRCRTNPPMRASPISDGGEHRDVARFTDMKPTMSTSTIEMNPQITHHSSVWTSRYVAYADEIPELKPVHLTEADEFITDITKVYDQQLVELIRGCYVKWGVTIVVPKLRIAAGIVFRGIRDMFWLALHDADQCLALVVLLIALRVAGRLRIRLELPIAVSAIVQDERFSQYDWRVLYLVAQHRAERVPTTNPLSRALFTSAVGLFFGIFQILAVELTIRWNHISGLTDVYSVSQFLPLLGGAYSLCRVLHSEAKYVTRYGQLSLLRARAREDLKDQESEATRKV